MVCLADRTAGQDPNSVGGSESWSVMQGRGLVGSAAVLQQVRHCGWPAAAQIDTNLPLAGVLSDTQRSRSVPIFDSRFPPLFYCL